MYEYGWKRKIVKKQEIIWIRMDVIEIQKLTKDDKKKNEKRFLLHSFPAHLFLTACLLGL